MTDAKKPKLSADIALDAYWTAAQAGKLLLKHGDACDKPYYYPRPLCPFCMSDKTSWLEASGAGVIYSWGVQRRPEPAYAIAFVTLAEGPTILSALIDCDLDGIAIDQPVQLAFEERDGQPTPVFRPV